MSLIQAALPPAGPSIASLPAIPMDSGTRWADARTPSPLDASGMRASVLSASRARPLGDRMLDEFTRRAAGAADVLGSIQRLTSLQASNVDGEANEDDMSLSLIDLQVSMSRYMIDSAIDAAIAKQIPATVNALTR